MAVVTRSGSVLLNPSERAFKFSLEMKHGRALTNDGHRKTKNGEPVRLTKEQMAYRAGYLQHQKDGNNVFKAKHPSYRRKTKRR